MVCRAATMVSIQAIASVLYVWLLAMLKAVMPSGVVARKNIKAKIVLITGAGGGIGRCLAERFARLGSRLVLWDINETSNAETAAVCRVIGAEVHPYKVDMSSRQAIRVAADRVKTEVGDVDILINNAGITFTGDLVTELTDEGIELTQAVNCTAHFWALKAFLPAMLEKNDGHVVCIASAAAFIGVPGEAMYVSSKFGAAGFMEALANDLFLQGKSGVKTTLVCPSFVRTPMMAAIEVDKSTQFLEPEDVAEAVIEAVLIDQRVLFVPKMMYIVNVLKSVLPSEIFQLIITRLFVPIPLRQKKQS